MGANATCSLRELMRRIVHNLYSYDYKSPNFISILAQIQGMSEELVCEMVKVLESEEYGYLRISWASGDQTVHVEILKKSDEELRKLSDAPFLKAFA